MLKNQRLTLALALALGSGQVLALGLGTIDVRTKLNEQLVAEIPILGSSAKEIEALQVRLASPEAFARIGIDRPTVLSANLRFAVEKNAKGDPVIRITTPSKVREPYLNFLLEVEWGRGRMMREFTVLLDPPVAVPTKVVTPAQPPRQAPRPSAPSPTPALAAPPPLAQPAPPAASRPAPASTAPAQSAPAPVQSALAKPVEPRMDYGPVQGGETLWAIAQRTRPSQQVSMNQMMVAIQAVNPQAFIDGNINRLKRGAVLRIPSADQLAAISQQAAAAQVIEQTREWRAESDRPAASTTLQPEAPATTRRPDPRPSQPADSRLELVPPGGTTPAQTAQSGAAADAQGRELRAELSRAREQLSIAEQERKELQSRVSDLEGIQESSRKLIELKDSQLAEAQARIAELEKLAAVDSSATSASTTPDTTPTEPSQESTATDTGATEPTPPADPVAVDGEAPGPVAVADPAVSAPEPLPSEPAPSADAAASGDEASGPWYLKPLNLALLLVGLGAVGLGVSNLRSRKRRQAESSGSNGAARKASIADRFGASAVPAAAVGASGPSEAELDEEGRLLDAISAQPDDLGNHLALVRHYYNLGDPSGFEGAAEAMNAQVFDPDDMRWKQVEAMGRELLPDHPMFAPAVAPVATQPPPSYSASKQDLSWEEEPEATAMAPTPPAPKAASDDWNAPEEAATTGTFDLDEIERLASGSGSSNDAGIEFDIGAAGGDSFDEGHRADATAFDVSMDDLGVGREDGPSFDLDTSDAGGGGESNEEAAATKLELARAYLDMGDVEGARGMLEEVAQEGNPGQRSEAKRLIDEIR